MYERGVADAERGESHPFYYQHYYHYRRGYDQARRRLRRSPAEVLAGWWWIAPAAVAVVLLVVFVLGNLPGEASEPPLAAAPVVSPSVTPAPTSPTRTPLFPTAVPSATPAPIVLTLAVGGRAQVTNTEGRALRGRAAPGLGAPVRVSFAEGEQVQLLEGPVPADGYIWWRLEGRNGAAWAAQQSLEGVVWLMPVE